MHTNKPTSSFSEQRDTYPEQEVRPFYANVVEYSLDPRQILMSEAAREKDESLEIAFPTPPRPRSRAEQEFENAIEGVSLVSPSKPWHERTSGNDDEASYVICTVSDTSPEGAYRTIRTVQSNEEEKEFRSAGQEPSFRYQTNQDPP